MFLKNIKKRNALRNYTITSPIIADYFTLEVILKLLQIIITRSDNTFSKHSIKLV
jgi:hypothetical protein